MLLICHRHTNPYFNMAAEEYFLRTAEEETVFFWRNEPAVIIGRNQNACEQVNFDFADANGIAVVRRLSGGGAVFHDLGNINYTFITPKEETNGIDFSRFSSPIIAALKELGVSVCLSGRNDLFTADGRKCSGVAACSYEWNGQKRMLHHGTLLFSADLSYLENALLVEPEKIKSKGIASVKSRVGNIKERLDDAHSDMTPTDFLCYLEKYMVRNGAVCRDMTEEQEKEIASLAEEKYKNEAWLLGARTEKASYTKKKRFDFGTVFVSVTVLHEVGWQDKIRSVSFTGDFFGTRPIEELENRLALTVLSKDAILNILEKIDLSAYLLGASPDEIADLILQ